MQWEPGNDPTFLLNRAAKLLMRRADDKLRDQGLAAGHIPVLRLLADGEARTQIALATHAQIEQPTMAQLLNRMERDGLVKRAANPADARSSLFSLTPRALGKIKAARAVVIDGSRTALAGFSASETEKLGQLLARVIENLSASK